MAFLLSLFYWYRYMAKKTFFDSLFQFSNNKNLTKQPSISRQSYNPLFS